MIRRSATKDKGRLQNFTGPDTLVTDHHTPTREKTVTLRIVPIVLIKATESFLVCLLAKNPFVPGAVVARGDHSKVFIIGLDLSTDVDALIADIAGVAFKETGNLPFTEIAE